jgi:predicted  nucleic acid-binding Zn-ribbon protein
MTLKEAVERLKISSEITSIDDKIHHLRDVIDDTRGSCPHDCTNCENIETKLANSWYSQIEKLKEEKAELKKTLDSL